MVRTVSKAVRVGPARDASRGRRGRRKGAASLGERLRSLLLLVPCACLSRTPSHQPRSAHTHVRATPHKQGHTAPTHSHFPTAAMSSEVRARTLVSSLAVAGRNEEKSRIESLPRSAATSRITQSDATRARAASRRTGQIHGCLSLCHASLLSDAVVRVRWCRRGIVPNLVSAHSSSPCSSVSFSLCVLHLVPGAEADHRAGQEEALH